jgi:hypothetical protein
MPHIASQIADPVFAHLLFHRNPSRTAQLNSYHFKEPEIAYIPVVATNFK